MRRSVLAAAIAVLALAVPAVANAIEVGSPDGRAGADVAAEPNEEGDGGRVRVRTAVGALRTDNEVRGDASPEDGEDPYPAISNPPMFGELGGSDRGMQFEELYGPHVTRAALGTGGLTAGIGDAGVLTNLSWPGPGSPDHVSYATVTRGYPNKGAAENAGAFGGLLLPAGAAIDGRRVLWFTATEGWEMTQAYAGPTSGVLATTLRRNGIQVRIRDVVDPVEDVLARSFHVTGAPEGSRLVHYANMDPTTSRVPRLPANVSGATDMAGDFATVYDGASAAMLHFRPYTADPAAASVAVTGNPSTANTADALARTVGPGVYVAIGGDAAPVEVQAGVEAVGLVRGEAEGTVLLDPYYDARDGSLSGATEAFGRTAGALAWEGTEGTVYFTAAAQPTDATALLDQARQRGFDGIARDADADWEAWTSRSRLPAVEDPTTLAVAQRALMIIRTAQDRQTGAIVASTSSQTPYKQDWLRDGAFFNYALLLAGHDDMVRAHNDFYRRAQSATGHWDPILCTDGAQCSAVFPFEIDSQAFAVWALWLEYELSPHDPGALDRLRSSYDAIRRGAEILYGCQDPSTGLQCYASEDDTVNPTQGGQGAAAVHLGLRSAAAAARLVGDPTDADRWDARADELRAAARERLCDPDACDTGRGYMIWPGKILTATDAQAADDGLANALERRWAPFPGFIDGSGPGYGQPLQYPMEPLFSLATTPWRDHHEEDLAAAVAWLTHDLAAPGVLHYAERQYHLGGHDYLYTVGFPHIWSGAEVYIAAALIHGVSGCPARVDGIGDAPCVGARRPPTPSARTPRAARVPPSTAPTRSGSPPSI